ncbi:hypothetical protein [Erythrobacter sp. AP23]|uniref:hypothetical protein n=1 Tax=Erythrobacter sp. AP23 TaxID=499656 RepID=UPI00076CE305|nr:hypothetical protein [Erythrobacter sp. AP23]KWV92523.1 hypothetical protein ASS64_14835 [Erythrobacter sp. AP23]
MACREAFAEQKVRRDLAILLMTAASGSGRTRKAIAQDAKIHRDALRRILSGERSASLAEASSILAACDFDPQLVLVIFILTDAQQSLEWAETNIGAFLGEFLTTLPVALVRELGSGLQEVRPRWAKGSAHRVARLLSDNIKDLERKDPLYLESV